MLIIGIAGGTGSGKTTVVNKIVNTLPADTVAVIPQDSYYNSQWDVPEELRKKTNFDHPDAFEWPLLAHQIEELRNGHAIEQPPYSYLTCTRQKETEHLDPHEVVLLEGILVLSDKRLRNMMDIKVFVDADGDDRLIRVISRDCIERGRTPQMVIDRYERVLKPMHLKHIEPAKRFADLIVPQGGHNEVAINLLTDYIMGRINNK